MPVEFTDTQAAESNHGTNANLRWSRYASQFDEMCTFIPVYQENIDTLIEALPLFDLPENPRICDLGAGTGNFVLALQKALPGAQFTHVDMDPVMNEAARHKYALHETDVTVVENYIQRLDFEPSSFDLIICVNALCHASPQALTLRRMNRWLTDQGTLFVIDFGRPLKLIDWGWYIFTNAVRKFGLGTYLKALFRNRDTFFQNRRAKKDQESGSMWLHTHDEFEQVLQKADFELIQSRTCYRGYCDMAICKPADPSHTP